MIAEEAARNTNAEEKILFWILIPVMCLVLAGVGYGTYLF